MSVREEDRQKSNCSSRGWGIAAAAIGVGVGSALYYFFSKRAEHPDTEGSTTEWNYDRTQPFFPHHVVNSDDSYTTISEHDTSDTSINAERSISPRFNRTWSPASIMSEESDSDESNYEDTSDNNDSSIDEEEISESEDYLNSSVHSHNSTFEGGYNDSLEDSDSVEVEWEVTTSSPGFPVEMSRSPLYRLLDNIGDWITPRRMTEEEQMNIIRQQALMEEEQKARIRQQAFRERTRSLEECSICFDVMLRDQEVMSLPCTHNFHTECIMPWLQEKQTCPNCRKDA